jgi:hypothetical protein
MADVRIENHGSIFVFELLTDAAREFVYVANSMTLEKANFFGNDRLVVEHRYAGELAQGFDDHGLEVE